MKAFVTGILSVLTSLVVAQGNVLSQEAYLTPPDEIAKLILAPRYKNSTLANISPDRARFLITLSDGMPPIALLAKPYYNLGGEQVDPNAHRDRNPTVRSAAGFEFFSIADGKRVSVEIPKGARVSAPEWSPDGSRIAFLAHFENGSQAYVADAMSGKSRSISRSALLATLVTSLRWSPDGGSVLTVLVPQDRGNAPLQNGIPDSPKVRVSPSKRSPQRTYPSLLETSYDKSLLEYCATGQLALISIESGRITKIGKPAMIRSADISPDGAYVRVTTMLKPFSYVVPVGNFGSVEEIWDLVGAVKAELSKRPLREGPPDDATRQPSASEKRNVTWRPDGKGISFLQMEEAAPKKEGEPAPEEPKKLKDRVMLWTPPYGKADTKVVFESENRMSGVQYSADCKTLFITETNAGTEKLYAVSLDSPDRKSTIYSFKTEDVLKNPGNLMTKRLPNGTQAVRIAPDGTAVFLSGTKYSVKPLEDGPRPFIDRVEIASGKATRIFESDAVVHEQVAAVLDDEMTNVVITRQSPVSVPDSWLRNLKTGEKRLLTSNRDYTPEITNCRRKILEVTRVDGVKFWVNVTLPGDYVDGTRLPALFWFYPNEFTDQKAYDRSKQTYNRNTFPQTSVRSMQFLTRLGYAVVEPDCPIIGPAGRMNDRYVSDLRNSLAATIDALDKAGYIDRERLAIGGHSYGAFSAANAMVHTPFFKAGIAGDGAYNRLLTPNGFQTESRLLWDARETYLAMSPILYAEQLSGALLLYHGVSDQNVGTFPINSQRMFDVLSGLGKPVSLYMYPYEDHGPVARETILDMWARWIAWLDKYVKNVGKAGN